MALRAVVDRAVHPARVKALDAAAGLKRAAQALARAAPELIAYDFAGRAGALLAAPEVELAVARAALARAEAALLALPLLTAAVAAVLIILVRPPTGGAALAMAVLGAIAALEGGAALTKEFERRGMEREALRRLDALPAPDPQIRQGLQNHAVAAFEICIDGRRARLGPGDRLLIAGASGTGKTRLLETLLGFRAGPAEIRLDGRPLSDYDPREARSLFAFAAQDAPLLSGSIWENLTLGAPGLTRADAFAALDAAGLGERVRRAPEGLATLIGDHGERLSGGERKRLALARALLRPAPFLMLDEPTEGLDAETEALVTENLQARLKGTGQGLILVSHRLAPQALCRAILHL
jgi:ATP-binding cassette subfamily C protein CydC